MVRSGSDNAELGDTLPSFESCKETCLTPGGVREPPTHGPSDWVQPDAGVRRRRKRLPSSPVGLETAAWSPSRSSRWPDAFHRVGEVHRRRPLPFTPRLPSLSGAGGL
jgi:hypothetical protein